MTWDPQIAQKVTEDIWSPARFLFPRVSRICSRKQRGCGIRVGEARKAGLLAAVRGRAVEGRLLW